MVRKNVFIALLFLLGVTLLVYPLIDRSIQNHKQNELLTGWDNYIKTEAEESNSSGGTTSPTYQTQAMSSSSDGERMTKPVIHGMTMLGTLHIDAIDVNQPILEDATDKSLKYGIGTVLPEIEAGQLGNYVLAGHRGRSYGKLLNRLIELEEGDEIVVESLTENYSYYVTESYLVEPDELWVLDQDDSARELTLITCHPVKNPTHRLIVKAVMK